MRAFRENTKWIFYILAIAFVGWLVFDVGMGITGGGQYGGGDVVLKVNGVSVHAPQYQEALQAAYEQYRQQTGSAPTTREDEQQIQDQVVEQLIQNILLQREFERLGLTATDRDIIEAARTSPLPELMRYPEFQTDGQFDYEKYQRFLASGADPQFLAAIEARYREQIPQYKLGQYLTADVYVSDAKLWRVYRDQHDSVTVAVVAIFPHTIPDSTVPLSDAEAERHLQGNADDFKRPAVAYTSFVAQPRWPDHTDSLAARARAARVRAEVARGPDSVFAVVARRESADSTSGREGGDLGWFTRNGPGFDPAFLAAVRTLRPGQISQPVLSRFGWHIIRLDAGKGDSVKARHILIPVELQGPHLDYVEARADTLDRLAAERTDGTALDSAAKQLSLPLATAPRLVEGDRVTLGRYVIPDVGVWAFEAAVGETSPVIEGQPAYYVFRLDSLTPAGIPPLAQIRDQVIAAARLEKKKALARTRAEEVAARLRGVPNLTAAATALGVPPQTFGAFTRLTPPSYLGREPLVMGAAFGLRVAERSGLIAGEGGYFLVESLARKMADSTAWLAQRDQQRDALVQAARQARIQAYLQGLRAAAKVVDRRKELYRTPAQAAEQTTGT
ncbi:MAG: SurA N-terminal domain-containing protein [Gemmatimonadetes bacterium]|nr:SurA N-terminal domain-containing protein [Gemmatimonadota bacterium]